MLLGLQPNDRCPSPFSNYCGACPELTQLSEDVESVLFLVLGIVLIGNLTGIVFGVLLPLD